MALSGTVKNNNDIKQLFLFVVDFYGKITELRQNGVKVILGVGGLEDSEDEKWHKMATSPDNRKKFVRSVQRFLRKWNFEGLQLAWQYPGCNQVIILIELTPLCHVLLPIL